MTLSKLITNSHPLSDTIWETTTRRGDSMIEFFGDRLQNAREKKGLNSKQACTLCNVSPSMWSLYESNKRLPSVEALMHISKKLDVSVDYLLGLKNEMKIKGE